MPYRCGKRMKLDYEMCEKERTCSTGHIQTAYHMHWQSRLPSIPSATKPDEMLNFASMHFHGPLQLVADMCVFKIFFVTQT